jgi:hypothetical protein
MMGFSKIPDTPRKIRFEGGGTELQNSCQSMGRWFTEVPKMTFRIKDWIQVGAQSNAEQWRPKSSVAVIPAAHSRSNSTIFRGGVRGIGCGSEVRQHNTLPVAEGACETDHSSGTIAVCARRTDRRDVHVAEALSGTAEDS